MQSIYLESCTEARGSLVSRLSNTVDKISNVLPEPYQWHPVNLNGKSPLSCTTVFQQKRSKDAKSRDSMEEVRGRIYEGVALTTAQSPTRLEPRKQPCCLCGSKCRKGMPPSGSKTISDFALSCRYSTDIILQFLGPARVWTRQWLVLYQGYCTVFSPGRILQTPRVEHSYYPQFSLSLILCTTVPLVQYWAILHNFCPGFKMRCTRFNHYCTMLYSTVLYYSTPCCASVLWPQGALEDIDKTVFQTWGIRMERW